MPSAAIEICDLWMAEADDRDLFFIDLSKIILPVPVKGPGMEGCPFRWNRQYMIFKQGSISFDPGTGQTAADDHACHS